VHLAKPERLAIFAELSIEPALGLFLANLARYQLELGFVTMVGSFVIRRRILRNLE
jgi:hypothetical protein